MRRPLAVLLAVSALALAGAWARSWLAGREAALAGREALAEQAAADAGRVLGMRAMRERASLRRRPDQDLATRLGGALAAAGIPRESMDRLTLVSDAPAGGAAAGAAAGAGRGPSFRTQSMQVSLRRVRLEELGRLLARWREAEPLWTATSLELARSAVAAGAKAPAEAAGSPFAVAEERYDVTIVLAAVYAADVPPGDAPGGDRR